MLSHHPFRDGDLPIHCSFLAYHDGGLFLIFSQTLAVRTTGGFGRGRFLVALEEGFDAFEGGVACEDIGRVLA